MASFPMTVTFTQRVQSEAHYLLNQARYLRDFMELNPSVTIIDIKLEGAKPTVLLDLCKQVQDVQTRKQCEFIIQKAQKKLAQAEQIDHFSCVSAGHS